MRQREGTVAGHHHDAVSLRVEQLSRSLSDRHTVEDIRQRCANLDEKSRSSPASRANKHERKLRRLAAAVDDEQVQTAALREALDEQFCRMSSRHSTFMAWYREEHRRIDHKYAMQGVYTPHVTVTPTRRCFPVASPCGRDDDMSSSPMAPSQSAAVGDLSSPSLLQKKPYGGHGHGSGGGGSGLGLGAGITPSPGDDSAIVASPADHQRPTSRSRWTSRDASRNNAHTVDWDVSLVDLAPHALRFGVVSADNHTE